MCDPVDQDLTDPDVSDGGGPGASGGGGGGDPDASDGGGGDSGASDGAGGVPVVCECPAGMQFLNDTRTCGASNTSKSTNTVC